MSKKNVLRKILLEQLIFEHPQTKIIATIKIRLIKIFWGVFEITSLLFFSAGRGVSLICLIIVQQHHKFLIVRWNEKKPSKPLYTCMRYDLIWCDMIIQWDHTLLLKTCLKLHTYMYWMLHATLYLKFATYFIRFVVLVSHQNKKFSTWNSLVYHTHAASWRGGQERAMKLKRNTHTHTHTICKAQSTLKATSICSVAHTHFLIAVHWWLWF